MNDKLNLISLNSYPHLGILGEDYLPLLWPMSFNQGPFEEESCYISMAHVIQSPCGNDKTDQTYPSKSRRTFNVSYQYVYTWLLNPHHNDHVCQGASHAFGKKYMYHSSPRYVMVRDFSG